jgi:hypothetical protein
MLHFDAFALPVNAIQELDYASTVQKNASPDWVYEQLALPNASCLSSDAPSGSLELGMAQSARIEQFCMVVEPRQSALHQSLQWLELSRPETSETRAHARNAGEHLVLPAVWKNSTDSEARYSGYTDSSGAPYR